MAMQESRQLIISIADCEPENLYVLEVYTPFWLKIHIDIFLQEFSFLDEVNINMVMMPIFYAHLIKPAPRVTTTKSNISRIQRC